MKKTEGLLLCVIVYLGMLTSSYCQELPTYNHYFNNPYFFNPSYAGLKNSAELNLLYRQQWVALEGAPTFSYLTLTTPISKKMGLGLNLYNNKRGVISTMSAQIGLSYMVRFSRNANFSFGLSAGMGRNGLDLSKVDLNDPVIAQVLSKSYYLEGQTGINFQYKNLTIGYSMPRLFNQSIASDKDFQHVVFNPFQTALSSISYMFGSSRSIKTQPTILYKQYLQTNQLAGYVIFFIKDFFWLGGSYRQNYGMGVLSGFQIGHIIKLGYSYEFATSQNSELNFNTHEFSLSLKFNKAKVRSTIDSDLDKSKLYPGQHR
jgi:type IX secretion system PorP/SprF family membrane protein